MILSQIRSIVGDFDRKRMLWMLVVAIGLFICSAGFLEIIKQSYLPSMVVDELRLEYFAVPLIGGCAVLAFHDRSLYRAWLVAFALAAGVGIHLVGLGILGELPGLPFRVFWAIVVGLVTAATLGTLGGILGLGLRRLSSNDRRNP